MVKLIVLGPNFNGRVKAPSCYRGLERVGVPDIPRNSFKAGEIDIAFEKLMDNSQPAKRDGEYLVDYTTANEIAKAFSQYNEKGDQYEVIEVVYENEIPKYNQVLLGFDVIMVNEGNNSAILSILSPDNRKINNGEQKLQRFRELLNGNFLFDNPTSALNFSSEAQRILGSSITLRVIGIYST